MLKLINMKKLLLFVLFFSGFNSFSQKSKGYYGRRFFVGTEVVANFPGIYNLAKRGEKYDHQMNRVIDKLNYGFHLNGGVIINKNFALSIDYSKGYFDICPGSTNYKDYYPEVIFIYNGESQYLHTESMQVRSNSFMLKFEVGSRRNLMPLGLSNQFGIGISYSKVINHFYNSQAYYKPYDYVNTYSNQANASNLNKSENYYDINPSYLEKHLYDFDNQLPTKTIDISYGLTNRTPLTKQLMLSYGIKVMCHLPLRSNSVMSKDDDFIYSRYKLEKEIIKQMSLNVFHFNWGITYVF